MTSKPKTNTTGEQWAFFRIFRILYSDGWLYLWRLRIIQTPWFAVYLHKIVGPDPDPDPHNHPWNFRSFILRGGYEEEITNRIPPLADPAEDTWITYSKVHTQHSWHKTPKNVYHRIIRLVRQPTWTLVFAGPRVQRWGFLVRDNWTLPRQHMDFEDYFDERPHRDTRRYNK